SFNFYFLQFCSSKVLSKFKLVPHTSSKIEMEDKESTESGSPGGKSESESPPITSGGDTVGGAAPGGDTVSCGGGVALQAMNMSIERSVGVIDAPAITVGGILGVGGGSGSGGGKKRGRPRKYDSDGNLRVPLVGSPPGGVILPPAPSVGFTLSPNPASKYSSGSKKGRGRPTGSGNWQILASLGELFTTTAGGDFTPHMITVYTGEDVAGKIITFAQKGPRGICVLSANGSVSNVTIRQPGSSGGILTYEA
ncbi:AT-hook motif nuclear-localized 7-like, partial [Olea europaea subsp. europaea]